MTRNLLWQVRNMYHCLRTFSKGTAEDYDHTHHVYTTLLFIQNISQFLTGSNSPADSSSPAGVDQIWKMRAMYHQFDGILYIGWETRLIDCMFAWKHGCLGNSKLLKKEGFHGHPKTK